MLWVVLAMGDHCDVVLVAGCWWLGVVIMIGGGGG